jgi:SAM-dependent methyltransferase
MRILSQFIYLKDITIDQFLIRKDIKCLGMMDPMEFATPLAQKIDYINTFADREPYFDICNISSENEGRFDFVICSEIFEHLSPPINHAFLQLKRLLKPGGSIIFTVPYNFEETTKEYFPDLFDYTLCRDENGPYLINIKHRKLRPF